MLWSSVPEHSVKRIFIFFYLTTLGIVTASKFTIFELLKIARTCLIFIGILSVLWVLKGSGYGDHGEWTGIYPQKNYLANSMAFGCLVQFVLISRGKSFVKDLSLLLFFAFLLIMADGKGGLLSVIAAVGAYFVIRVKKRPRSVQISATRTFTILIVSVATLITCSGLVLTALGRDPSLTGRTDLWKLLWTYLESRGQLLGFGFDGFWGLYKDRVQNQFEWAGDAHNGYLDVAMSTGIIGGVLILFLLFKTTGRSAISYLSEPSKLKAWPFLFLIFNLVLNISAVTIAPYRGFYWTFLIISLTSVSHIARSPKKSTTSDEAYTPKHLSNSFAG